MDDVRFDRLTRVLGRRAMVAGVAAALGGAAVTGRVAANGQRPGVCRPTGAGCTRSGQCCTAHCATSRALPRRLRNRCSCPAGSIIVGGQCVEACDTGLGVLGFCLYDLDGSVRYPCELAFLDANAGQYEDPSAGLSCRSDADCEDLPWWRCVGDACRCVTAIVNDNGTETFAPVCAFAIDYCG